jgi:hypothetical protein
MARTTPEKLAQALRANLRRRKARPAGKSQPEAGKALESPPEQPEEKPQPKKG